MTTTHASRSRHDLLVRMGLQFVAVSVAVYEPAMVRATVFCLHDYAGTAEDFEPLARFLVANGCRVVCPDFPGRGQSAWLSDPMRYSRQTYLTTLMQVMQTFGHRKIFVIGKGWGGLIALLLIKHMQFDLAGLVLSDLALRWSLETDPVISEALHRDTLDFATSEAAEAAVAASYEFRLLDAKRRSTMTLNRLRRTETGYSFHYDPAIRRNLERLRGRHYNVSELLGSVESRLLFLLADPLSEAHRTRLEEVIAGVGGGAVDQLARDGRVHFNTVAQLLLVLGFLTARRLPTT